ncbi:PTPA-CTERM sorting domain-containing protein [Nodosilinea sp. PGN35]|uniref:PTPA-CTERM sorting domain-containing protein n=1 Tax=Nodosilinea sp. PGN35 TaxID=3020489 RepID=UPI0023B21144|nr:PTPA-CTERM sorting domain-containing protein [Nodosilinea sp. TSF1-S3]MDF0369050.1 PTPA-CTERM sorting domain-containing protein [Nodosilinea sp. TSF1-S3]
MSHAIAKKASFAAAGAMCVALTMAGSAQALTLTFDDLPGDLSPISSGYGGLNWENFWNISGDTIPFSGYENGTFSSPNVAFNAFGDPAEITSGSSFTFTSAYLAGAWNNSLNILIEGFQGLNPLFSQNVVVDSTAPTLFTFNWIGVDRLRFTSSGGINAGYGGFGNQFILDNFTFNKDTTAIPTPALLPGLIGMGVAALRKRKGEALAEVSEEA